MTLRVAGPVAARHPACGAASLALLALLAPSSARAAGYAINDQGARAMGHGLATAALLEGPETSFYNPAGLAGARGWSLTAGSTLLLADFASVPEATGTRRWTSARDRFVVPHLALVRGLRGGTALALSVNAPYGLATEWDRDFPGRFTSRLADLQTVEFGALVAGRLGRGWSLGGGPTFTQGDVRLVRDVDLSIFRTGHQAEADLTGDGGALGWRLGARWDGGKRLAFGLALHGERSVRFRGDVDYTVPLLGAFSLDQAIATLFQDGSAATTLTLPLVATAGVAWRTERWRLGADVTWTGWSVMDAVVVDLDPIIVDGQSLVVEEFVVNDWSDVLALRLGARRRVSDRWSWSAGAYFDQSPVPVRTADPLLPDSDRRSLTGGGTLTRGRFTLDLAAQVVWFDDLDTRGTSNPFPAAWDAGVAAVAVTAGWRWGRP